MRIITNWELFLESQQLRRDPDDMVDLYKITTYFDPEQNYNAYSVLKDQNEDKCKRFHGSAILSKKKDTKVKKIDKDEKYFHQYVQDWIKVTGSASANVDKIASHLKVQKINKKFNPQNGRWESTPDKIRREDANKLKALEVDKDSKAFKTKTPFIQKSAPLIKSQTQIKLSPLEIEEKQRREKKFWLKTADYPKLDALFEKSFIEFYKAGEGDEERPPFETDQIAYWSGIYNELYKILENGSWFWAKSSTSTEKIPITPEDNIKYNLNLKMNPNIFADQLEKIEFDSQRKKDDAKDWDEFDLNQLTAEERISKKFSLGGRRSVLLGDGTIRISILRPRVDSDKIRLIFYDRSGKRLNISSLVSSPGGGCTISFKEGPKNEKLSSSVVDRILKFVDTGTKKATIDNYIVKKDEKLPYRSVPIQFKELYDFLLKRHEIWKERR